MKLPSGRLALILAGTAVICLLIGGALITLSGGLSIEGWFGDESIMHAIDEEQSFEAEGIDRIELQTISSDICWHAASDDQISLRLSGRTNLSETPVHLLAEQHGATLQVEVKHRSSFLPNVTYSTLDVYVPEGMALDAAFKTVSGDIEADGLNVGELRIDTTSGDLDAQGITAGRSTLGTVSGRFTLDGAPGVMTFHSVSGRLDVSCDELKDDIAVSSTSGQMNLDLPDGANFELEAGSVSGHIRCDFPVSISRSDNHHLSGTVGKGTNRITINTISGGINIM